MLTIQPENLSVKCLYHILSPVSHHDATAAREANASLYNRQLVRVPLHQAGRPVTFAHLDAIAEAFPVPIESYDIFEDEPFADFVAIAIVKTFIQRYSTEGGIGLFEGVERYRRLSDRIQLAAPRSPNLKFFWSLLTQDMQVGPMGNTKKLFKLLAVPSACHHEVLYHFQRHATMTVEMARDWYRNERLSDAEYAKKAKSEQTSGDMRALHFDVDRPHKILTEIEAIEKFGVDGRGNPKYPTKEVSVAIPCHSGNDIRHDIRYAAMVHLFDTLGLDTDTKLPVSVKALLENGGNIAKGKSAPSDAFTLAQIIREKYPSLGLLGGCTESFMLGDSNLFAVSPFWYGREYNDALETIFGVSATDSVIDLLDDFTLHRHSGRTHDQSPMPYSFEGIQSGAKLYVQFKFSPHITDLERGAFGAALRTFQDVDGTIGGQSAKGFGQVKVEVLETDDGGSPVVTDLHIEAYEAYLNQNFIELAEGLQLGTLCSGKVVCEK